MNKIFLKNGDEAIIRMPNEDDAEALLDYLSKVFGETDNLLSTPEEFSKLVTVDKEKQYINSLQPNQMLLVEYQGVIVGTSGLNVLNRERNCHLATIGISVLRDYWGLGIGQLLMKGIIDSATHIGIEKINLEVRTDNQAAINLYKKLGFHEIGINTRAMKVRGEYVDNLIMGLEI